MQPCLPEARQVLEQILEPGLEQGLEPGLEQGLEQAEQPGSARAAVILVRDAVQIQE